MNKWNRFEYIISSFWLLISNIQATLIKGSPWIIGKHYQLRFWKDAWKGTPFSLRVGAHFEDETFISNFISKNGNWLLPFVL